MPAIVRLSSADAPAIVECFKHVYGASYANELFYEAKHLAAHMGKGTLNCVGAITAERKVVGHMAMTVRANAPSVELGNTVVDPALRGQGIAWQVGAELTAWAKELGFTGYLHYPTTDHHIMQRQSVKQGYETGLMLGYIPAETDGKVREARQTRDTQRQAATIVYEPFAEGSLSTPYLPERFAQTIERLRAPIGITRRWQSPSGTHTAMSAYTIDAYAKRGLDRLTFAVVGHDAPDIIHKLDKNAHACLQIDFQMSDGGIGVGVEAAVAAGYRFCGWLPGLVQDDMLRMQKVDTTLCNMQPELVNPTAQSLLRQLSEG